MQQLGDDQVRDLVVDGRAEEDDPLVEQTAVDVERALAARGLLDDHWDKWAHSPPLFRFAGRIPLEKASGPASTGRPASTSPGLRRRPAPRSARPSPASTAPRAPAPAASGIGLARSAIRSIAWRAARSSRTSSRRPAARRSSSSVCGSTPSRSAVGASACQQLLVGRADPLGRDDRRDHGLAAQRLLGLGLHLGEDLRLAGGPMICR